jgi:hypothetical protein
MDTLKIKILKLVQKHIVTKVIASGITSSDSSHTLLFTLPALVDTSWGPPDDILALLTSPHHNHSSRGP